MPSPSIVASDSANANTEVSDLGFTLVLSGSDRAVCVAIAVGLGLAASATAITSVTCGGSAMNLIVDSGLTNVFNRVLLYEKRSPANGAVSVNIEASSERWAIAGVGIQDVDQVTPFGTPNSNNAEDTNVSVNIAAVTGQLIIDGGTLSGGTNITGTFAPNGSQTLIVKSTPNQAGPAFPIVGISTKTGNGSIAMSWSGGDGVGASVAGVAWNGSSGGTNVKSGESLINSFTSPEEILRAQNFFHPQAGIIPQGHKVWNIPFSFQHLERDLEILRVQSQFKAQAGVQPGPVAGYKTYNKLSLYQADPTDLGVERVKNVFQPRTGIIPSTKRTYLRNADIDLYAERFDFFGWSIILASASPGVDPLPDAIIRKTYTNAYIEALDLNWNNTSIIAKQRQGNVPPPTKAVYNHIFLNPLFVDTPFEFANSVIETGNKIGIPGAIPRRVVRALTEVARQIQEDINEFPRLFLGIRVHQIIGAPPAPDPVGNLIKRQNVGVGVKLQGG